LNILVLAGVKMKRLLMTSLRNLSYVSRFLNVFLDYQCSRWHCGGLLNVEPRSMMFNFRNISLICILHLSSLQECLIWYILF